MRGIDVSTLQGVINWEKVKKDDVSFAMIKATQGRGEGAATRLLKHFTDSKFKKNIVEASKVGIACGVYHYMTAQTIEEARQEAEYFCSVIKPYRKNITLWAAVDVESEIYLKHLGKNELAKIIRAFMEVVKHNRFMPMLYTNPDYLTYRLPKGEFDDTEIWLAHWGVMQPMKVPNTQIWQYDLRAINGIAKPVDANVGFFDEAICAISKLSAVDVINTSEYWLNNYKKVKYLDELLVKSSMVIDRAGEPCKDLTEAVKRLHEAGIINTPQYWINCADELLYLPELIMKLGGSV